MDRFLCQLCYTIVRCGENHPCFCYDDNEPNPNVLEANNTKSAMLEEVHCENFNDNSAIIYSNFQQKIVEATSEETAENNEQISLLPEYHSLLPATSNNKWSLGSNDNSLLDSTTVIRKRTVVATKNSSSSETFCGSENTFESPNTLANTALPLGEKTLDEFEPRKNLLDATIANQADTGSLGSNTNAKLGLKKSQEFNKDESAVAGVPVIRPSLQATAKKRKRDSDLCPQKLKNEACLISHDGKRKREKPFECNTCNKRFSRKSNYINHLRTHTGEKPYGCEYCESRFRQKGHYTTHLRTHTGEKPYKCEYCESRFRQKVALDKHRRVHTGEKPFKCEICKKDFADPSNLRRHAAEAHTQEKPFKCGACEKAFKTNRARNKHREKKH